MCIPAHGIIKKVKKGERNFENAAENASEKSDHAHHIREIHGAFRAAGICSAVCNGVFLLEQLPQRNAEEYSGYYRKYHDYDQQPH